MLTRDFSASDLREVLSRDFGHGYDRNGQIKISGPVHNGPRSSVYRATLPAFERPVAVKVCFPLGQSHASAREAQEQHEAMSRAQAAMAKNPRHRIPHVFGVSASSGYLLLEWVEGESLDRRALRRNLSRQRLIEDLRAAGQWLKSFHDAQRVAPRAARIEPMLETLAEALALGSSSMRSSHTTSAATSLLHEAAESVEALILECSWLHGDFKPHDVIVADDAIYGTDMSLRYHNPCVHDLVQFASHLSLLCLHPRALHLARNRDQIVDAFLDGYAEHDPPAELGLCWFRLHSMLRLWAQQSSSTEKGLRAQYNSLRFRHFVRALTERLRRAYS